MKRVSAFFSESASIAISRIQAQIRQITSFRPDQKTSAVGLKS